MASQTINLPGSAFGVTSVAVFWNVSSGRTQIDAALTPSGQNRYFRAVIFHNSGAIELQIDDQPSAGSALDNDDLSQQFETNGSFTVSAGSNRVTVNMSGRDTSDPYAFTPDNSSEVRTFHNAVRSMSNVSATLILDDGAAPPRTQKLRIGTGASPSGIAIGATKASGIAIGDNKVWTS